MTSHGKQLTRTMQLLAAERGDVSKKEIGQRIQQARMWRESAKALARLKRFEEREALVQKLLESADSNAQSDLNDSSHKKALAAGVNALRDFKLEGT